ncbi:MAG: YihY/virulence factor BrkB family protein [Inquilinaceae bacterium]
MPPRGWWEIVLRVKAAMGDHNISVLSAGCAFYALLAIFPALSAMVAIYGLIADPVDVRDQLGLVRGVLPSEAYEILDGQMRELTAKPPGELGLGLILGLAITVWSATKGVKSLMGALNIIYGEREDRGLIKVNAVAVGLTAGAVFGVTATLFLLVALPGVFALVRLGGQAEDLLSLLRWPLLAVGVIIGLGVIYRYGPSRRPAKWRWLSVGAVAATVLWIVASGLLSFYVESFGSYNETYGSIGAVVVLLMWFYVTAYTILLGGELNAALEHQTARDSTVGAPRPMGERGAFVADTLPSSSAASGEPPGRS